MTEARVDIVIKNPKYEIEVGELKCGHTFREIGSDEVFIVTEFTSGVRNCVSLSTGKHKEFKFATMVIQVVNPNAIVFEDVEQL